MQEEGQAQGDSAGRAAACRAQDNGPNQLGWAGLREGGQGSQEQAPLFPVTTTIRAGPRPGARGGHSPRDEHSQGRSRAQCSQNHGPLLSQIHSCFYFHRKGHTERLSSALLQKYDFVPFLVCSLPMLSLLFLKKLPQHSYSAQAGTGAERPSRPVRTL